MTTPYRGYSEIPGGVVPDVPYRVNLALREIDADVQDTTAATAAELASLGSRVKGIETLGGVSAGSTTDATMSVVAEDPESDFTAAMEARYGAAAPAFQAAYVEDTRKSRERFAAAGAAALRPFHAALANRSAVPVDILAEGDSITEGYSADRLGERWVDVLLKELRARFPIDAEVLYAAATDSRLVRTGTAAYNGDGGPAVTSASTAQTVVLTTIGSRFDVAYVKGLTGVGTLAVSIDGGAAQTVSTVGPWGSLGVLSIPGLTEAPHTVTVSAASGSPSPVVIKSIRAYRSVQGGTGYHPAYHAGGEFEGNKITRTGAPVLGAAQGLGARSALLKATTDTLTFIDSCTAVDVFYTKTPTGEPLRITVDGGAEVPVPTSGTAGTARHRITGLTPGVHSVKVTGNGGSIGGDVQGFMSYTLDEAKGIRLWEAGRSGATTAYFNGDEPHAPLSLIQPSLVLLGLGVNDFGNGISPASYRANMLAIIGKIRARCTVAPSIVLLAYQETAATGATSPWADYIDVLYELAEADPGLAVFDLQARMNPGAPSELDGMIKPDLVHPLNKGMRYIGGSLAGYLSPR